MLKFERNAQKKGFHLILGIDEAGRGPLAGPVVAAAVSLKEYDFESHIRDSKKMSAIQRERAFHEILEKSYVGVGVISESVVDSHNILQATYLAMSSATRQLIGRIPPSFVHSKQFAQRVLLLVDGNRFESDLPFAYETIIKGDSLSLSIACASIVAKVMRDRILNTYDQIFPEYGFRQHKGYPTRQHKQAIKQHGPSLIHRKTFNSV